VHAAPVANKSSKYLWFFNLFSKKALKTSGFPAFCPPVPEKRTKTHGFLTSPAKKLKNIFSQVFNIFARFYSPVADNRRKNTCSLTFSAKKSKTNGFPGFFHQVSLQCPKIVEIPIVF